MADKHLSRIEAKIDALLDKAGIKPESVTVTTPKAAAPRPLSAAEKQAIANAPATPVGANGPAVTGERVEATTNAPVTPAATDAKSGARK